MNNWLTRLDELFAGRKTRTLKTHHLDDPHAALTGALYASGGLVAGTVTADGLNVRVRGVVAVVPGAVCSVQVADLDAAAVGVGVRVGVVMLPDPQRAARTYQSGRETVTDDMAVGLGRVALVLAPDINTQPAVPDGAALLAVFRRTADGLAAESVASAPRLRHTPDAPALGYTGPGTPYSTSNPVSLRAELAATIQARVSVGFNGDNRAVLGSNEYGTQYTVPASLSVNGLQVPVMQLGGTLGPVAWRLHQCSAAGVIGEQLAAGSFVPAGDWATLSMTAPGPIAGRVAVVFDLRAMTPGALFRVATAGGAAPYVSPTAAPELPVWHGWAGITSETPLVSWAQIVSRPRGAVGRLSPDALPTSAALLALAPGEGYIYTPAGAAPEWRYKREDGQEFRAPMVAV